MACGCLSLVPAARSGAKPLVPFGKGRSSQEGGNTGRRAMRPCCLVSQTAVRSAPGQGRAEAGLIPGFCRMTRDSASLGGVTELLIDRVDAVGKLDRDEGTLAQVLSRSRREARG